MKRESIPLCMDFPGIDNNNNNNNNMKNISIMHEKGLQKIT